MIEIKQNLVAALILGLNPLVLQITPSLPVSMPIDRIASNMDDSPCSHPPVPLISKSLNMTLHSQSLSEPLHSLGILVLGRKHADGDLDPLGIV